MKPANVEMINPRKDDIRNKKKDLDKKSLAEKVDMILEHLGLK